MDRFIRYESITLKTGKFQTNQSFVRPLQLCQMFLEHLLTQNMRRSQLMSETGRFCRVERVVHCGYVFFPHSRNVHPTFVGAHVCMFPTPCAESTRKVSRCCRPIVVVEEETCSIPEVLLVIFFIGSYRFLATPARAQLCYISERRTQGRSEHLHYAHLTLKATPDGSRSRLPSQRNKHLPTAIRLKTSHALCHLGTRCPSRRTTQLNIPEIIIGQLQSTSDPESLVPESLLSDSQSAMEVHV